MRLPAASLLGRQLAQNILSLCAVQCATYLAPLLTVPYLAWVLGPAGWGRIAFAQSFAAYLGLLVEYGFNFSATREVAVERFSAERRSEILSGVLGAKCLLATGAVLAAVALHSGLPVFRDDPGLFAAGVGWALAQAFNMSWYFLGLEQVRLAAGLDIGAKVVATLAIFTVVKNPGDGWKVLALQAAAAAVAAAAALAAAWREVGIRLPRWRWVREALRRGRGFLLFRAAETLYTSGNPLLLGLFCDPVVVGYFAGAEKICRGAFVGLIDPVNRSLYPRITHLMSVSREKARCAVRAGTVLVFGLGIALGLAAFGLAGPLVGFLLGPSFEPAVPALRILAVLPAAIALKWAIGLQWMMPLGLERSFNAIILGSAVFHAAAGSLLAPRHGHVGMAVAVALTELLIPAAVYLILRARGLDPLFPPAGALLSERAP